VKKPSWSPEDENEVECELPPEYVFWNGGYEK